MTDYREIDKRSRARAAKALALRRQGMTYEEIGKHIGTKGPVCREVARQAVLKGERLERRKSQCLALTPPEKP